MKAPVIDFAPPAPWHRRPIAWVALSLAAASAGVVLATLPLLAETGGGDELAAVPLSGSVPPPVAAGEPAPAGAAEFARWAQFDHAGALASIESAQVPGVRVSALELSAVDGSVRLELELQDPADALRYLSEINAGMPEAHRWRLVRSQAGGAGGRGTAILALQ